MKQSKSCQLLALGHHVCKVSDVMQDQSILSSCVSIVGVVTLQGVFETALS